MIRPSFKERANVGAGSCLLILVDGSTSFALEPIGCIIGTQSGDRLHELCRHMQLQVAERPVKIICRRNSPPMLHCREYQLCIRRII